MWFAVILLLGTCITCVQLLNYIHKARQFFFSDLPFLSEMVLVHQFYAEVLDQNLLFFHRYTNKLHSLYQLAPSHQCGHKHGIKQLPEITKRRKFKLYVITTNFSLMLTMICN